MSLALSQKLSLCLECLALALLICQCVLPLEEVDASLDAYKHWNPHYSRNTRVGNVLGMCALTLPCGFTSNGLPIGLMMCGKGFDEATVLRVGYAYEQATEWHRRTPDLSWAA